MTREQYLDTHQAEVFAEIAERVHPDDAIMTTGTGIVMLGFAPDWIEYDPINNAEQRWELLEWYIRTAIERNPTMNYRLSWYLGGNLIRIVKSDNPPRELVLVAMVAMDMLEIGYEDKQGEITCQS